MQGSEVMIEWLFDMGELWQFGVDLGVNVDVRKRQAVLYWPDAGYHGVFR